MRKAVLSLGKKFFKTELVSGSLYIMIAGTLGSFIAFIFNLFLARNLSYIEYGVFTSLISFIGLITIPSQAITILIIQYATQLFSKKEIKKVSYLYNFSLRYMLMISVVIFLIFIGFSSILANFLRISSVSYLWATGLLVALYYFGIVNNAFLQSLLRFKLLAWSGVVSSFAKLLFGVILITIGIKVLGALGATVITVLIVLIIGFYALRSIFFGEKEIVSLSKKDVFSYAVSVSIISLSLASFTSMDIILVKHFFSPHDAGLYSGLSLIGRVIFYFTAPIATVLFPLIIKKYHQGINFLKTFYAALGLVIVPSLVITIFYFLFPKFTINFFLGGRGYLALSPNVGLYGLYLSIFSALNIIVTFFLSLKKTSIMFPMVIGSILQIVCIYFFHANFFQVIFSSIIVISVLLLVILLYYVKYYGAKKELKTTSDIVNNPSL